MSLKDFVGEPLYFPMPSAFGEDGYPNRHFTEKCRELRDQINRYLTTTKDERRFEMDLSEDVRSWSTALKLTWRNVLKYEDVLSPADFKTQAQRAILHKHVDSMVDSLKKIGREQLSELGQKILNEESHHKTRVDKFKTDSDMIITELMNDRTRELMDKYKKVDISIKQEYKLMLESTVAQFRVEENEEFMLQSEERNATVDLNNGIENTLKKVILELRENKECDDGKIEERYNREFDKKIKERRTKQEIQESVMNQLTRAYTKQILQPNAIHGRIPSAMKQLNITFEELKIPEIQLMIVLRPPVSRYSKYHMKKRNRLATIMQDKVHNFIKEKVKHYIRLSEDWIKFFKLLDESVLDPFDQRDHCFVLSSDFRSAAHKLAFDSLSNHVLDQSGKKHQQEVQRIKEMRDQKWALFRFQIQGAKNLHEKAQYFAEYCCSEIPSVVKRKWFNQKAKQLMDNWMEEHKAKKMISVLYDDSFGKGNTERAFKLINNMGSSIKDYFHCALERQKQSMLNDRSVCADGKSLTLQKFCLTSMRKDLDQMLRRLNNLDYLDDESKSDSEATMSLKDICRQCLPESQSESMFDMNEIKRDDLSVFVNHVKAKLSEKQVGSMKMVEEWIQDYFSERSVVWEKSCVGCPHCCPFCGIKCMHDRDHPGPHFSDQHMLIAFQGTRDRRSNKLSIDVCTSPTNQIAQYARQGAPDSEFVPFPDHVQKHHPDWFPIDKQDFQQAKVAQMLRSFFWGGSTRVKSLQDLILERYPDCKAASESDIRCIEYLNGYYTPRTSGSLYSSISSWFA